MLLLQQGFSHALSLNYPGFLVSTPEIPGYHGYSPDTHILTSTNLTIKAKRHVPGMHNDRSNIQ